MTLRNPLASACAAAVFTLLPLSISHAAEEWKFAIEEIPGSIMDAYAQEFKTRIESATEGDVEVTIYPMGTLGTPTETVEQAADGVIQFTNVSIGNLGTIVPESQVFLLPYLLPTDSQKTASVLSSSPVIYQELNEDFRRRGLEIVSMYSEGAQVWTTNRAVRNPEQFDNFKMRVMVSPILLDTYKRMGASPTPLPFGEVFGALQLGAVDGQVNPIPTIEEMKFYEVTSHLIWAGEQELVTTVVAGSHWFETLSPERQSLVRDTLHDMTGFIHATVEQFNDERLTKIKAAKPDIETIVLSEEERAVFREQSEATAATFVADTGERGQQLVDALRKAFHP